MTRIPTVRLYHPDGGKIRVNVAHAERYKKNGWSEEAPAGLKHRPNPKAMNKSGGKGGDKDGGA